MFYRKFFLFDYPECAQCRDTTFWGMGDIFYGVGYMLATHFGKYITGHDVGISMPLGYNELDETVGDGKDPDVLANYIRDDHSIILYDMEHAYPSKYARYIGPYVHYKKHVDQYPTVWSFQIENYEFFKEIGKPDAYKFVPLRYTNYYDKMGYVTPRDNSYYPYELQFEGKLMEKDEFNDTIPLSQSKLRNRIITNLLSKLRRPDGELSDDIIGFNITNTHDIAEKCRAKQLSRYCLDVPRNDGAQTINNFRIWENTLLNCQTIVVDPSNITMNYFDDIIILVRNMDSAEWDIEVIAYNYMPRLDVKEKFREMTESDEAYDNYRIRIIKEFVDRTGIMVPDSVLKLD